jgi:superfamily II DNA or RNA helicase
MKRARALKAAGGIQAAEWEAPVLRGRIATEGREFQAGLKITNPIDIENLCPCRDSRGRGIICAHSVAVGLEYLSPGQSSPGNSSPSRVDRTPRVETTEIPRIEFSIEGSLRHLEGALEFRYSKEGSANSSAEAIALIELSRMGFEDSKGKAVLRGEEAVVRFYATGLPKLRKQWNVKEGERFLHVTRDIVLIEPHFALKERGDGWLDFHVHFTADREAMFRAQDIQRLLAGGDPRVKLSDGRIAVPDAGMLADFEEVLRDCDPLQERGAYRIRDIYRPGLEAAIGDWTNQPPSVQAEGNADALPQELRALLRGYQVEGALWMRGLAMRRAGGLLADEMGLGKTIQALAMAASLAGPHLVVCPSPLVWNWEREARRFCPGMRVLVVQGSARESHFSHIGRHDLVITSYALLRRDIQHYKGIRFTTATLDEAQHIKNPDSQNAAAAVALEADARFILTGTPLENSLRDLWSLFHFLLPGYLGKKREFKERYEDPLQAGEAPEVWRRLLRRVRPWMLRRMKSEVAADLPEYLEQTLEIDLTPDQKAAYTELQLAARAGLDDLKGKSSGAARMKVLTALLRLRQACCDVRLLGAESEAPSGKLDALLEILRESMDGGHRTLVFSQFTSMLDLIAPALDEAEITWCRLDGSTRDRQAVVDAFQAPDGPAVFLISLKAGGAGLNLTAANTVVHFDPWWNPAVEAQATARAHRIGQKSAVTSIKLVARDTVEQRVLEMQAKKRTLLGGLLEAAEPSASAFDDETLRELIS